MAILEPVFLDTSILLMGLLDFGEPSRSPMLVYDAVVDGRLKRVSTAWHCCLEFYSVSTRLPMEYRVSPTEALLLLKEEVLLRVEVFQLPRGSLQEFLDSAIGEQVKGGRIYDAHIAEIAKSAEAGIVVTNNQRHFTHLLKENIRVLTADQLVPLL